MPKGIYDRRIRPAEDRFWLKVNKGGPAVPGLNTPCWLWTGAVTKKGYGHLRVGSKYVYAHRFSLVLARGPLVGKLQANHLCQNRNCVNPDHLYAGTQSENMWDSVEAGTKPVGSNHMQSKLTEAQVLEIRSSEERGVYLAEKYGVSPALICMLRQGKGWDYLKHKLVV